MITTTLLFFSKKDFQKGFFPFFARKDLFKNFAHLRVTPSKSRSSSLSTFPEYLPNKNKWRKKNRAKNVEFLENRFELQRTCYTFFHAGKSQQVNNINCWKNFHCRGGTIRLTGIKADSLFAALVLVVLTILGLKNRK